jgi:hypothetical protein
LIICYFKLLCVKKLHHKKMKFIIKLYYFFEYCFYKCFCGVAYYLFLLEVSIPSFHSSYEPRFYNYLCFGIWIFIFIFCCVIFLLKKDFIYCCLEMLLNMGFFNKKTFRKINKYRNKLPSSGEFLFTLVFSIFFSFLPLFV